MSARANIVPDLTVSSLPKRLEGRSIVFVGLMGAGKTAIGRKVATMLSLPFIDSDHEIETVSRMTIPDLFERYGEAEFRALEQRVILRLLENGPQVLSTGGGAYIVTSTLSYGVTYLIRAENQAQLGYSYLVLVVLGIFVLATFPGIQKRSPVKL